MKQLNDVARATIDWLSFNLRILASAATALAFALIVALLLVRWRSDFATVIALAGALSGWAIGILLAPYKEERARFDRASKAFFGFAAGFGLGKIDHLVELLSHESPSLLINIEPQFVILGFCSLLLTAIVTFVFRSYWENDKDEEEQAMLDSNHS